MTLLHADRVEYLEREGLAILTGRVRVAVQDSVIAADTVRFDQAKDLITAEGSLTWVSATVTATGSRMTYRLSTREGEVEDVSLLAGLWLCRGARVVQPAPGEITVSPGVITTCDRERPHYSIRCRRIRIRVDKDLTATSVTLLVGTVPVLWLPWLVTPLRELRLPFEAQVGSTRELGVFVRTSPAYQITARGPGRLRLDYFARKGFGYGVTQEWLGAGGARVARAHAYQIREREPSGPGIPRRRWELFGEGAQAFGPATRLTGHAAYVSDARVRELYGIRSLPVSLVAGDRRAAALLTRAFGWGDASVLAERVEAQRLTGYSLTDTGRFALASVRAPGVAVAARPVPLASWLSASARAEAARSYDWLAAGDDPGWYVTRGGLTPALEAFGRIPGVGRLTVSPRLSAGWRDRGDRVLLASGTGFVEDVNRGGVLRAEAATTLRRTLPGGADAEATHAVTKRLNKVSVDPFERRYRGVELHQARGRLAAPFGRAASTGLEGGYDLRNTPDPPRRRWLPLTVRGAVAPGGGVAVSADGEFDLWHRAWRRVGGAAGFTRPGGLSVQFRPSVVNNALSLPLATTTSPEYRIAQQLYAASFQSAAVYPRLVLVDLEAAVPVTARTRLTFLGQFDARPPADAYLPVDARGPVQRHIRHFTLTVTRDLHCWELTGAFERYASGELRFNASLNLKAFPTERVPLVSL